MIEIGPKSTQIAVMQYSSYTRVEFGFSANPVCIILMNFHPENSTIIH